MKISEEELEHKKVSVKLVNELLEKKREKISDKIEKQNKTKNSLKIPSKCEDEKRRKYKDEKRRKEIKNELKKNFLNYFNESKKIKIVYDGDCYYEPWKYNTSEYTEKIDEYFKVAKKTFEKKGYTVEKKSYDIERETREGMCDYYKRKYIIYKIIVY